MVELRKSVQVVSMEMEIFVILPRRFKMAAELAGNSIFICLPKKRRSRRL